MQSKRRSIRRAPPRRATPAADRALVVRDDQGSNRAKVVAGSISGLSNGVWNWVDIEDYTVRAVQDTLARRRTPTADITQPRMDVAVPAIEAMRYSPLKQQIAGLIATSMDRTRAADVHPSFIEMLKQLTEDEVAIIAALPAHGLVLPMLHINYVIDRNRIVTAHRNVVAKALAAVCSQKSSLPQYIDNLMRMNIVETPRDLAIDDDRRYRDLLDQDFVKRIVRAGSKSRKPEVERSLLGLTHYGYTFRRACLD